MEARTPWGGRAAVAAVTLYPVGSHPGEMPVCAGVSGTRSLTHPHTHPHAWPHWHTHNNNTHTHTHTWQHWHTHTNIQTDTYGYKQTPTTTKMDTLYPHKHLALLVFILIFPLLSLAHSFFLNHSLFLALSINPSECLYFLSLLHSLSLTHSVSFIDSYILFILFIRDIHEDTERVFTEIYWLCWRWWFQSLLSLQLHSKTSSRATNFSFFVEKATK